MSKALWHHTCAISCPMSLGPLGRRTVPAKPSALCIARLSEPCTSARYSLRCRGTYPTRAQVRSPPQFTSCLFCTVPLYPSQHMTARLLVSALPYYGQEQHANLCSSHALYPRCPVRPFLILLRLGNLQLSCGSLSPVSLPLCVNPHTAESSLAHPHMHHPSRVTCLAPHAPWR